MKKRALVFAFCSLLSAESLSFQEAWRLVLNNNHALKAGKIAVQKSEKLNDANTMLYLPKIDLTANYVYLGDPVRVDTQELLGSTLDSLSDRVSSGLSNSAQLGPLGPQLGAAASSLINNVKNGLTPLDLSNQNVVMASVRILYPLYAGGAIKAVNELGKLALKDAKEALRLKTLSTFEKLAGIYYGVVLNQEMLRTLQEVENGHKLHLENAKKLQQAGQIAKIEVLSAQVAYNRAKNDTLKAKDSLEVAQLALQTILSDDKVNYQPNAKLRIKPNAKVPPLQALLDQTLSSYPLLNQVKIKEEQAQEALKLARSKFIPHFALFGSYTYHRHDSILGSSMPSWYVGVGMTMPLLDNTGSYQKFQASKIAQLEVSQIKTQAIKDISLLVEKTYKEALQAKEFYFVLNSSIALAEENLKLQEQAFKQGMGTSTKVVDARNLLSKAKIEQQSVAYKYLLSIAKLMALSDQVKTYEENQQGE